MSQQRDDQSGASAPESRNQQSQGADEQDDLEAEQESAEAMDAEVPQPPGADGTTEGQPS